MDTLESKRFNPDGARSHCLRWRSFIGNGAYVPDGTTVPENVLIGVLSSVPRNASMQDGDTWLGAPPLRLPAREQVAGFPEHLTFAPSPWRKAARGLVEAFRIAAPHALVIATGYAIVLDAMPLAEEGRWAAVALDLAVGGMLFGMATFGFVALFKWLAVRRYGQRAAPMWTPFVWLSGVPPKESLALLAVLALMAAVWNGVYNSSYDWIEGRLTGRTADRRPWPLRILHAAGFEGGLLLMTLPVIVWWTTMGWIEALVADLGLAAAYTAYAFVFNVAYDRLFPIEPRAH